MLLFSTLANTTPVAVLLLQLIPLLLLVNTVATISGAAPATSAAVADLDPRTDPAAIVISPDGVARFSILTPWLIRMEYAADGAFEDRASMTFVQRKMPAVPLFNVTHTHEKMIITTYNNTAVSFTATTTTIGADAKVSRTGSAARSSSKKETTLEPALTLTYTLRSSSSSSSASSDSPAAAATTTANTSYNADALCANVTSDGEMPHCPRCATQPSGSHNATGCAAACAADRTCRVWVVLGDFGPCYTLTHAVGVRPGQARTVGGRISGFTPDNLQVEVHGFGVWHPGALDTGNLLGTIKSLDGITGATNLNCTVDGHRTVSPQCSSAPISQGGWALIDDTASAVMDMRTQWRTTRSVPVATTGSTTSTTTSTAGSDLYLFGYGHDYRRALKDYSIVCGRVPKLPRFVFGVWWSRYWPYTAEDLEEIASGYASRSIPIDVVVSDMAWHFHNETAAPTWGGYTWSPELFPEPQYFLKQLSATGLNTTLNLHLNPVHAFDAPYEAFARALNIDPSHGWPIPSPSCPPPYNTSVSQLLVTSRTFASAYLDIALDAMGTDWWWLDDTPVWVSRLLYEHAAGRMQRGLAFSRWGGMGSHRYPIGFSGDTYIAWSSLAFQPVFTAAASNVLFWWSHDIGGHRSKHDTAAYDSELYLRWLQWGAHAPIMRTHPQPDPDVRRRPYAYGMPEAAYMQEAMTRRAQLVPLLYSSFNSAFTQSGVSPLHPLYYDWPEHTEAYEANDTYVFCDNMIVAPVTLPQDNNTQVAARRLWLPPGTWVDTVMGRLLTGPKWLNARYTLWEVPIFVRSGTVLPMAPPATSDTARGNAAREPQTLVWEVWHGGQYNGTGLVHEDNGGTTVARYNVVTSTAANSSSATTTLRFSVNATQGRLQQLELKQTWPAFKVAECSTGTVIHSQRYSGADLQQIVTFSAASNGGGNGNIQGRTVIAGTGTGTAAAAACVELTFADHLDDLFLLNSSYRGRRLRAHRLKAQLDHFYPQPTFKTMDVVEAANTAVRISAHPASTRDELERFDDSAASAVIHLGTQTGLSPVLQATTKAWLGQEL